MQRAIALEQLPNLPYDLALNDPDDTFLFAMAVAAEANYLVTGDRRAGLLKGSAEHAGILTPSSILCRSALIPHSTTETTLVGLTVLGLKRVRIGKIRLGKRGFIRYVRSSPKSSMSLIFVPNPEGNSIFSLNKLENSGS